MKKILVTLIIFLSLFSQGFSQISCNLPSTVSSFGGRIYINFTIASGQWYNSRSSTVSYNGLTFPWTLVSQNVNQFYVDITPNNSCPKDLTLELYDIVSLSYATFYIHQFSTIPGLTQTISSSISTSSNTISNGKNTVCPNVLNTFTVPSGLASTNGFTTWIPYSWSSSVSNVTSTTNSFTESFTTTGNVYLHRTNGCSNDINYNYIATKNDTFKIEKVIGQFDSVSITPSSINLPYGLPITFTATGTQSNSSNYTWNIINSTTTTPKAASFNYTYTNYNQGDEVYVRMRILGCVNTVYKYSNKVILPSSPITEFVDNSQNISPKVYPNPFNETFNVDNAEVNSVFDSNGNDIQYTKSDNSFTVSYKGLMFIKTDKGVFKLISE